MENEELKPQQISTIHQRIEEQKRTRFLELLAKIKTPNLDKIIDEVGELGIPKVMFCSLEDYPLVEPAFSPYLKVMSSIDQAKGTLSMSYTTLENLEDELNKKALLEEDRRRVFWASQRNKKKHANSELQEKRKKQYSQMIRGRKR